MDKRDPEHRLVAAVSMRLRPFMTVRTPTRHHREDHPPSSHLRRSSAADRLMSDPAASIRNTGEGPNSLDAPTEGRDASREP